MKYVQNKIKFVYKLHVISIYGIIILFIVQQYYSNNLPFNNFIAQAYLANKLRKQSEQQKQVCNFISNGNLKLKTEIKIAEQEVQRLVKWYSLKLMRLKK